MSDAIHCFMCVNKGHRGKENMAALRHPSLLICYDMFVFPLSFLSSKLESLVTKDVE